MKIEFAQCVTRLNCRLAAFPKIGLLSALPPKLLTTQRITGSGWEADRVLSASFRYKATAARDTYCAASLRWIKDSVVTLLLLPPRSCAREEEEFRFSSAHT